MFITVDFLSLFKLCFSWFLVLWVTFNDILSILAIIIEDFCSHLNVFILSGNYPVVFITKVVAYPFPLPPIPLPPCNHYAVVHVHESFFFFAQLRLPPATLLLAVSLLSIYESVRIFLVSSACSLDSPHE